MDIDTPKGASTGTAKEVLSNEDEALHPTAEEVIDPAVLALSEQFDRLKISIPEDIRHHFPFLTQLQVNSAINSPPEPLPTLVAPIEGGNDAIITDVMQAPARFRSPSPEVEIHPPSTELDHSPRSEDELKTSFHLLRARLQVLLTREIKKKNPNIQNVLDLGVLSDFNLLREDARRRGQVRPDFWASLMIASCKVAIKRKGGGLVKGPWYARKLREMARHIIDNGCLPDRRQGKGATHHSHLNDNQVKAAIEKYLTTLGVGKVCLSHL